MMDSMDVVNTSEDDNEIVNDWSSQKSERLSQEFVSFRDWFMQNNGRLVPSLLACNAAKSIKESSYLNFLWHLKCTSTTIGVNYYLFENNIQHEAELLAIMYSTHPERYSYKRGSWTPFEYTG